MARLSISPKLARIDAKQKNDTKARFGSRIATVTGTPTRKPIRGTPAAVNINSARSHLSIARGDTAERTVGIKFGQVPEGRALASKTIARSHRGVSIWKNGLDLKPITTTRSRVHIEPDEAENEDDRTDDDDESNESSENEQSDEIWGDERTLIDGLMGFDDQSIHDKAKRQEALANTLKAHFSSLSVSIRQDLLDGVTPVIDHVTTTNAILHKGPDNEYQNGLVAFNHTAQNTIAVHCSLTEQFGELKDQSLTRLKSVVGRIESERALRAELCDSFKAQYQEICSRIQERLSRAAGEDLDRVAMVIETRAQAIVHGKDKDKEKMRQKILKAFA
ncbi:hypothetical protein RSOLAG22IIIB_03363 [Rhizoctonia solani]|uniref:Uncharacterized protein n=1 Tax=Rhizoctonia solani TaxID=456999 RepID=A0A0K6FQ48_9AGAM|nr:hypothetical protein RSOLAG22IIIB_03363 [Rhizoctonia solani]